MNVQEALKGIIHSGDQIAMAYVNDLNDAELLKRPAPGCNHINWQIGHCIYAENMMLEKIFPGSMPKLPAGFAERYAKETATSDDPNAFCKKDELLRVYKQQRDATLAVVDKISEKDLDKPSGMEWAPTVGKVLSGQGTHWLMHTGQWAVVRRQLGRPPLF